MSEAYQRTVRDVIAGLDSDGTRGLSDREARLRLERYGPNQLTAEPPIPGWRKFLAQFQDLLVILLLIATAISAVLWLYERDAALPYEAIAISAVVLLNAALGFIQEARAESAVAALRQMAAAHAHVIRDGVPHTIPAADVVPGDVLAVEEGDTIPADARVMRATALQTAKAALTGESVPVAKNAGAIEGDAVLGDRSNMIYRGTAVTFGRGRDLVVATGCRRRWGASRGC